MSTTDESATCPPVYYSVYRHEQDTDPIVYTDRHQLWKDHQGTILVRRNEDGTQIRVESVHDLPHIVYLVPLHDQVIGQITEALATIVKDTAHAVADQIQAELAAKNVVLDKERVQVDEQQVEQATRTAVERVLETNAVVQSEVKQQNDKTKEEEAPKEKESASTETPCRQDSSMPLFVHGRHTCDGCLFTPIVGVRYKSTTKADFDLCANCFAHYSGEDDLEPVVDDRDRAFQHRWQRRYSRRGNRGHGPRRGSRPCGRRGGGRHTDRDVLVHVSEESCLTEAIRRSLKDMEGTKKEEEGKKDDAAKAESPKQPTVKPTTTTESKPTNTATVVHFWHTCDGCETTPIRGTRYHAEPDLDLCADCYAAYDGDKEFTEVSSLQLSCRYNCDGCHARIGVTAVRFHAEPNVDLCEGCMEKRDGNDGLVFVQASGKKVVAEKDVAAVAKEEEAVEDEVVVEDKKPEPKAEEPKTEIAEDNTPQPFIHGRHTCDSCYTNPIVGLRYHTGTDYDLCATCYAHYQGSAVYMPVQAEADEALQAKWRGQYAAAYQAGVAKMNEEEDAIGNEDDLDSDSLPSLVTREEDSIVSTDSGVVVEAEDFELAPVEGEDAAASEDKSDEAEEEMEEEEDFVVEPDDVDDETTATPGEFTKDADSPAAKEIGQQLDAMGSVIDSLQAEMEDLNSATILAPVEDEASSTSWDMIEDSGLGQATQMLGSVLYNSDMERSKMTATEDKEDVSVLTVDSGLVSAALAAKEEKQAWAVQLAELRSMGYKDDELNLKTMKQVYAAIPNEDSVALMDAVVAELIHAYEEKA